MLIRLSTGLLPGIAGGHHLDPDGLSRGAELIGWPQLELRVFSEWSKAEEIEIARLLASGGFRVTAVHAPVDFEKAAGFPGQSGVFARLSSRLLETCSLFQPECVVLHCWDLRLRGFDTAVMLESLEILSSRLGDTWLSVEAIPGFSLVIPAIAHALPQVRFTVDTQWCCLEGCAELMLSFAERVDNIHVQTCLDPEGNSVILGRNRYGSVDVLRFVEAFVENGFSGCLTLEPVGVGQGERGLIVKALELLHAWFGSR